MTPMCWSCQDDHGPFRWKIGADERPCIYCGYVTFFYVMGAW